jgi:ribosomal protein S18 acetylase RimI-like enzyme
MSSSDTHAPFVDGGRRAPARPVTIDDWRAAPRAEFVRAYEREIRRARDVLHWDTRGNWVLVEAARVGGTLPGLAAHDATGALAGWTFYLPLDGALQIGSFYAVDDVVTAGLVDRILASPQAAAADRVILFAFAEAPALEGRLAEHGFTVEHYAYLSAAAKSTEGEPGPAAFRTWQPADLAECASVMGDAYPGADARRPFAPGGTDEEWRAYARALIETAGVGEFSPSLTVVAPAEGGGLDGLALVTVLGCGTAHLAQIAVRRPRQRRGLGQALVRAALARVRDEGAERMTLLVSERNAGARHLYDRLGFQPLASFLSAARG